MGKVKPKPGDLLCVLRTDTVLIKKGSCGVIEGAVGKRKRVYSVTFNPSPMPWWDRGIVTSSGGPVKILKAIRMKPTSKKRKQRFHYFPGLPGAGLAKIKTKLVNVFEIDLKK